MGVNIMTLERYNTLIVHMQSSVISYENFEAVEAAAYVCINKFPNNSALAEWCRAKEMAKCLFASSSIVFG